MDTTTVRKPASFRLNAELLETLKRHAKAANRSLNNYVESVLLDAMCHEPNEEARSGKSLEKLDLDDFDNIVRNL